MAKLRWVRDGGRTYRLIAQFCGSSLKFISPIVKLVRVGSERKAIGWLKLILISRWVKVWEICDIGDLKYFPSVKLWRLGGNWEIGWSK